MKSIAAFFCLCLLPFTAFCADLDLPAQGREVFVYLYSSHFDWDEYPMYAGGEEESMDRVHVHEDRPLYTFSLASSATYFRVKIGDKSMEWELPEQGNPLFIGIPNAELFPTGVEACSKEELLARRPLEVRIEGEMPPVAYGEVSLLIPFFAWPETADAFTSPLMATNDWRKVRFSFQAVLATRSIVFLQVGDRYFPLLVADDHGSTLPVHFVEEAGRLRVTPGDHSLPQEFLHERYQREGMTREAYEEFVQAFQTPNLRAPLIRQLNQEVLDSRWEKTERVSEFDDLFQVLHSLGAATQEQAFAHTYQQRVERENSLLHRQLHEFEEVLESGFALSLLFFAIAIVARIVRPRSGINRFFGGVELSAHAFAWLLLLEDTLFSMEETACFLHIGNWPLFFSALAAFYIMVFFLVPDLLTRGGWKKSLMHMGLVVVGIFGVAFFQSMNPFVDYSIVWTYDTWSLLELEGRGNNWEEHRLSDLNLGVLLFSVIYGAGRHVVTRRLTQLETRSSALGAELNALKTQISPHFFFNSLNTVYSFSLSENSPKTAEAITKLSDLMRFVIYQGDQPLIPLEKELDYLSDYVDLQTLRLDPQRHDVHFEVTGDPEGLQIAPLLLISLIENAFKHGISMSHASFVDIHIHIEGKRLELSVENSNHGTKVLAGTTYEKEGGVGLVNTRQRLELLYRNRFTWDIQAEAERYSTRLEVQLK